MYFHKKLHSDQYYFQSKHLLLHHSFDVVLGKSCSQAKHTTAHVFPGQKMPTATFSKPYITIYVHEKDQLIPKLCIR